MICNKGSGKKRFVSSLLLPFLFVLCGVPPLRALDDIKDFADYAFFSQYKSIEVARVGDGTGEKVKMSILEKVQSELRQALKRSNLPVVMQGDVPDPNKTLLLETRLIKYSGGLGSALGFAEEFSSGKSIEGSGVTLFIKLKDKKLDTELGTIKVSRGGFSKDGNLKKAADAFVEVVKKKMYDEEGKTAPPVPVQFGGRSSNSRNDSGVMTIPPGSNIAVLSFSSQAVSDMETVIVANLLRTEIVNLGINYYNVLDREYVDKVMAEHAFAATGMTSTEGAAALGKMLNAQKVVTGSLTKMMDTYFVTANMIDVESGKIESAASGDYKTTDDMKQAIQVVATQLVRLK